MKKWMVPGVAFVSIWGIAGFSFLFVKLFLLFGMPLKEAEMVGGLPAEWLLLALVVWFMKKNNWKLSAILKKPLRWQDYTLIPIGLYLITFILYGIGGFIGAQMTHTVSSAPPALPVLLGFLIAATGGFCEEIIFRIFLLESLEKVLPKWIAIIGTIFLFGLVHIPFWGIAGSLAIMLWSIPLTLYVSKTRKIVPNMIVHTLNDFLAFVVFVHFIH